MLFCQGTIRALFPNPNPAQGTAFIPLHECRGFLPIERGNETACPVPRAIRGELDAGVIEVSTGRTYALYYSMKPYSKRSVFERLVLHFGCT